MSNVINNVIHDDVRLKVLRKKPIDHSHDLAVWPKTSARNPKAVPAALYLNRAPSQGHAAGLSAAPLIDASNDLAIRGEQTSAW
jgi:hypothetical protein